MAVAVEQVNRARMEETRAEVLKAEAKVPSPRPLSCARKGPIKRGSRSKESVP
jgi:uncharacterized protein YqfA (UPF0365 family)